VIPYGIRVPVAMRHIANCYTLVYFTFLTIPPLQEYTVVASVLPMVPASVLPETLQRP